VLLRGSNNGKATCGGCLPQMEAHRLAHYDMWMIGWLHNHRKWIALLKAHLTLTIFSEQRWCGGNKDNEEDRVSLALIPS